MSHKYNQCINNASALSIYGQGRTERREVMYQSNGGLAGAVPGGSRRFRGNAGPHIAAGMFHQIFRLHRAAIRYASKFMSIAAPWSPIENHPPNVNRSRYCLSNHCFIRPLTIFSPLPLIFIESTILKKVVFFPSCRSNSNQFDLHQKVFWQVIGVIGILTPGEDRLEASSKLVILSRR